jgi:hypothetical protein
MKYLVCIFISFLTSCVVRTGYYSTYTPPTTTLFTPNVTLSTPTFTPYVPYWWVRPRTYGLGNVYNNTHHHHHYGTRPRTNLPLQNGPIGGRRRN